MKLEFKLFYLKTFQQNKPIHGVLTKRKNLTLQALSR